MRYHLTPVRMSTINKSTKREPSCTVGGNVNWYNHYGKTVWRFLRKLKIELPYDPAIPLLGIYPDKTFTQKDTCTPMFTAPVFTTAKTWKQPKRPSIDEQIKKMWYIHTMDYNSAIKKEQNNAICSNTDGPRDGHTKWSKSDRERQIPYNIT